MDEHSCVLKMTKVLQNILKRYNVQLFTKLILHPSIEEDTSITIRHYDRQCQSATNIVDVIETALQRKKIQAMITIKLFARPRFLRTNTPKRSNSVGNKAPYFRRKDDTEDLATRTQRSSSFRKIQQQICSPERKQMKQIFDKVRSLANNSLTKTPKKYAQFSKISNIMKNQQYKKKKNSFLHKLSQLEADFSQLIETEKKLGRQQSGSKQFTGRKRQSYRERGRQIRMIDINFC